MGRRLLSVGLVLLAVVLLAEAGVRIVEPRLEPPLDWFTPSAQRLIHDMDALRDAGVTGGLVLAGTSQTNTDLIAGVFERELDSVEHAANVGLAAATTRANKRWLLGQVVPRLQPGKIVWGLSSLDFNANRRPDTYASYLATRGARPGWTGSLDRKLSRLSALVRHRTVLADPAAFLRDVRDGAPAPDRTPTEQLAKHRAPDRRDKTRSELRRIRSTVLHDYEIGEAEVEAFRTTLARLGDADVEVVVVLLPVPTQFIASHPQGTRDFEAYRRMVREVTAQADVELLDHSRAFDDGAFRDYTHLLLPAAEELSRDIGRRLRTSGW